MPARFPQFPPKDAYMKRTFLSTSLALAVAGLLGTGAALAQYNAPVTTPPTPAATPHTKSPTANQVVAPSKTESGPSAFAKLDIKHQGYLNSEDVSQLQGFNFKNADKNGDGKLDAVEFNAAWAIYSGHA
jgi:hypothetical protein